MYIADRANVPYNQDSGYLLFLDPCDEKWIKFAPEFYLQTETKTVALEPTGGQREFSKASGPMYPATGGRIPNVYHKRGQPRYRVEFSGRAAKIGGGPIKMPKLVSYGGITNVVPVGEAQLTTAPAKTIGECDLHSVYWLQVYEVEGDPDESIDPVTNPNLRIP